MSKEIQARLTKVDILIKVANAVADAIKNLPAYKTTDKQNKILDEVLRYLDFQNEYALGYKLRKAFKMEIDSRTGDYYGDRW